MLVDLAAVSSPGRDTSYRGGRRGELVRMGIWASSPLLTDLGSEGSGERKAASPRPRGRGGRRRPGWPPAVCRAGGAPEPSASGSPSPLLTDLGRSGESGDIREVASARPRARGRATGVAGGGLCGRPRFDGPAERTSVQSASSMQLYRQGLYILKKKNSAYPTITCSIGTQRFDQCTL